MVFPYVDSTTYVASVKKLRDEFTSRFKEFRQYEIREQLFAHPFDLAMEDCPHDCKMELIELQADMDTKMGYSENSLIEFHRVYLC